MSPHVMTDDISIVADQPQLLTKARWATRDNERLYGARVLSGMGAPCKNSVSILINPH